MKPGQHFFLSFAISLLAAAGLAMTSYLHQDWLEQKGVPSALVTLGAFIGGHFFVRWLFASLVAVKCPKGCGARAFPIAGRSDRFRCEQCGDTF